MTFGEPLWFWAFALFPAFLALFVRNEGRREQLLRQLVAARLQHRLAGTVSVARRRLRFALLLLGMACVVVSLAQPRLGFTWEQSKRKGRDVIIAIDCSRSMLATDLAPNRLARAKLAAQDFIGQLQGDRMGVIAFAGSAFLQAPLTIDYGAVLNSLTELDTTIIPRGGTNIGAAIKQADEAFGKGESDNRCLIIFTDGEELDADGVAAAEAQKDRIKIFTVGLGSTDGSLIPLPGGEGGTGFVKDDSGQFVKSRLDEDRLRKIAEVTGGFYVPLLNGPAEMQHIVRDGLGQMKEQEIDARMSRRPIERYQWPLGAGLVFLTAFALISERKRPARRKAGALALAAFALLVLPPPGVEAKNSGVEAYEREDYQGAMDEFGRQLRRMRDSEALHFNLGAAAYKSGDFGKALEAFAKAVTSADPQLRAAAEYNLGNTLFQRGVAAPEKEKRVREWKDALQHYEQALQVAPQNQNAAHNRDIVRKLLEELEQQPPPPEEQQKQEQNKDGEKKDDQDQQQSKDKSENKDQPQKDESQQKDQPSQDSPGDKPENEPKEGSDPQAKNEEKKDGKDEAKQQSEPEKGEDKKDGQPADGKPATPAPSPDQPEKPREGEIGAAGGTPPPNDPQQEAEAEAQAAEEGKMTETQAKTLLESLKGEDDRVQLLRPGEPRPGRVFRDW